MNRLLLTAATIIATLAVPSAARADYVLDDFTNPSPGTIYQIALLNSNPYNAPPTAVSATVTRNVMVTVVAPLPPNFNAVSGTIGGGTLTMDTDNASAAKTEITYTLTNGSRNLSAATGLDLNFVNLDAGTAASSAPVMIELMTSTGTMTWTSTIAESGAAFTKTANFAAFSGTGNLSQVNSIKISLNAPGTQTAVDFALDGINVRVVPTPPAFLLAGLGAVALVGRSRLRRKVAA